MTLHVIEFDPTNAQINYQYVAQSKETGKRIIGFIVVVAPWYKVKKDYEYYIVTPRFSNDTLQMTFKRERVYRESIKPYTQTEEIADIVAEGDAVDLVEVCWDSEIKEHVIASIPAYGRIPLDLWESSAQPSKAPEPYGGVEEEFMEEEMAESLETNEEYITEDSAQQKADEPKKRGRKKKDPESV